MKTEFTKKEIERTEYLQEQYNKLEGSIRGYEEILSKLRKERNRVFAEFCHIVNPDPLPFDKKLLPYGWD